MEITALDLDDAVLEEVGAGAAVAVERLGEGRPVIGGDDTG